MKKLSELERALLAALSATNKIGPNDDATQLINRVRKTYNLNKGVSDVPRDNNLSNVS